MTATEARKPGRKSRAQMEAEESRREEEINARVDERVNALFAELKAQMSAEAAGASPAPTPAADNPTSQILSDLVVNMKKMMDPQSQKRVFSPEEMRQMEDARTRMVKLLFEAHEKGEMPVYALKSKVYLAEQKIEPQYLDQRSQKMMPRQIQWPRIPNEAMVPLNDIAKKIFAAFTESLVGTQVNRNAVPAFVLAGKEVRLMAPIEADQTGNAGADDPRLKVPGAEPIDYSKPLNVLGTVAPPVVPTQGARFEQQAPLARNG